METWRATVKQFDTKMVEAVIDKTAKVVICALLGYDNLFHKLNLYVCTMSNVNERNMNTTRFI